MNFENIWICRDVSAYTKAPELLGGRVKTLHPAIHAGQWILEYEQLKIELYFADYDDAPHSRLLK